MVFFKHYQSCVRHPLSPLLSLMGLSRFISSGMHMFPITVNTRDRPYMYWRGHNAAGAQLLVLLWWSRNSKKIIEDFNV